MRTTMRSKPKGEQLVNSFAGTISHLPLPVFVGHSGSGRSVAPCLVEVPLKQVWTHTHTRPLSVLRKISSHLTSLSKKRKEKTERETEEGKRER